MFKKSAAPAAAASGYTIAKSLRFRSSASPYLNRTYASTGNRQIFTISVWFKRGQLGSYQGLNLTACPNPPFGNTNDGLRFNSSDQLEMLARGGNDIYVVPNAVFRDPSSWYHVVVAVDTTQATASNRVKFYINGVLQTSFYSATYPTQNYSMLGWNVSGYNNAIGPDSGLGSQFFDGEMAEINVIDGSQQAVTSFGSFNSTTGVWQPAAYTGSYGTNGYYLKFTNTSSTATLGNDSSGNSNTYTTANFSLTAGSTYDSMTDVPTLTSATVANYAVLNPLSKGSDVTLTNGNLTYALTGSTNCNIYSSIGMTSGKFYCEVTVTGNQYSLIGISDANVPAGNGFYQQSRGYGYYGSNGNKYNTGSGSAYGSTFTAGDVIGIAFDADAGTLTFYKNNTSQGTAYSSIPAGTYYFCEGNVSSLPQGSFNFGQQPFTYTPPTGYVALNTYNLPTSTIVAGNQYMDATLWTANGTTQTVTNAGSFKPDLLWAKPRSAVDSNYLNDSVRGAANYLVSNTSAAEVSAPNYITSFNSNGFSIGTSNYSNGTTLVGWQWQAGQGSTSSNTNGSITSTVSVNATAGFSVVTYTGTGAANATIGHGLGIAPSLIFLKKRNATSPWYTQHGALGASQLGYLNTTDAFGASSGWNNTNPTSTVFSVASSLNDVNTFVAYCWAAVSGFSAFGSYTGNGSSDGPFVYTGFRPKFVMYKRTDSTGSWFMLDSSRNTYNVTNLWLQANTNEVEQTDAAVDFLSNGFKQRTTGSGSNGSGASYIYMAFAENPFKNALAR